MEFLNALTAQTEVTNIAGLACFTISIIVFLVFNPFARVRKTNVMLLKMQEENNRHLLNILQELKRSYRTLCLLADVEPEEISHPSTTEFSSLDPSSQTKLYVGNIDYAATEAELTDHFSRFGRIEFVNIPINRYNGRARGFGFVTFTSIQDAERAMALNGSEFKGRQIQVNFAKERD